jgi:hypothetical protein
VSDQIQEKEPKKSRRALLTAALGAGAAVAAQAAVPLAAQAHDAEDVQKGVSNTTTATTGIDSSATVNVDAFAATAGGTGAAVVATAATTGAAIEATAADGPAISGANTNVVEAAAYFTSGDTTNAVGIGETLVTGLYAWTPISNIDALAAGVWGDSDDIGVYGTGYRGVEGDALSPGATGVYAFAIDTSAYALKVSGKVVFSRSGRSTIGAGKSTLVVNYAGVTASSRVFAQLASNRSGRYVRAVVASTGKFTIYLNTTVTSSTYVIWWILN